MDNKFRAWDEDNKIMRYFNLFDLKYPDNTKIICGDNEVIPSEIKPFHKIMNCIDILDKNKKLIYSRDIIKRQNRYIGVVIFETGCFKIKWQDGVYYGWARHIDDYQENSLEIIGNIYENPELLEDENNGQ